MDAGFQSHRYEDLTCITYFSITGPSLLFLGSTASILLAVRAFLPVFALVILSFLKNQSWGRDGERICFPVSGLHIFPHSSIIIPFLFWNSWTFRAHSVKSREGRTEGGRVVIYAESMQVTKAKLDFQLVPQTGKISTAPRVIYET